MSPVAPRIVNDVSYVTDITHECHFSWQAQYLVKSGIAGERNVCNFQYKMRCRGGKSKLGERAGSVLQFHAGIGFGSWSNRSRVVNDTSTVFGKFL